MPAIARTDAEDSFAIAAIDVHAHFGNYVRDGLPELNCRFMSGDAACVVDRRRAANIALTVASPLAGLLPRGRPDAVAANEEATRIVDKTPGLLQWVIVHPQQPETFRQARERSRHPKCMGIKIHPEEHCYPIAAAGAPIFELAAELGAVILTHSGEPNSIPLDFVPLADRFPEVRLILAHLGNSGAAGAAFDWQVRAIQASKRGNMYVDTSSIRSMASGLIEWAVDQVAPTGCFSERTLPCISRARNGRASTWPRSRSRPNA